MNAVDEDVTLDPVWSEWASLLERNLTVPDIFTCLGESFDRRVARREILQLAELHTNRILELANDAGVEIQTPAPVNHSSPVVMTGHQPVVFHPGLSFKYAATCHAAKQTNSTALAITLDTDVGAAGHFEIPIKATSDWKVSGKSSYSLTPAGKGPFFRARISSTEDTDGVRQSALRDLPDLIGECDRNRMDAALRVYERLENSPADLSHSIARRSLGLDTDLYEIRLSDFANLPTVARLIWHLIANFDRLVSSYNSGLDRWRVERKIKNRANPFPNLSVDGERSELPFWGVDWRQGARFPLWGEARGASVSLFAGTEPVCEIASKELRWSVGASEKWRLVPRGAIISLIFRMLACDLFVHGLGGQSYDPFTSVLIRELTDCEGADFSVASRTVRISQELSQRLNSIMQLLRSERHAAHHPREYLGRGVFAMSAESDLRQLTSKKDEVIDALRKKRASGTSASNEGRLLHELQTQMKGIVAEEFRELRGRFNELTPEAKAAIECRKYPWFLFAEPSAFPD